MRPNSRVSARAAGVAAVSIGVVMSMTSNAFGSAPPSDSRPDDDDRVDTGTTVVSHVQSGHRRGRMSHRDSDDFFTVCDLYEDGSGVAGLLYRRNPVGGEYILVASADDGGDNNCDNFTYNIITGDYYRMRICWKGAPLFSDDCTDKAIIE